MLENTDEKNPNPDFFALALWQNLMGQDVMEVTRSDDGEDRNFRVYSHRSEEQLTFLLINLNNETSYEVELQAEGMERFKDFTVTAEGLSSQTIYLNGVELGLNGEGDFPNIMEMGVDAEGGSITIQPLTYGFYTFN